MLRNKENRFGLSEFQEEIGDPEEIAPTEWQQLIAKYEQEIIGVPLEAVRFADGHMGIISSPTRFSRLVDNSEIIRRMVEFESIRQNKDPDQLIDSITAKVVEAAELAGVQERWTSIKPEESSRDEVIAKSIMIAVRLLQEYIDQFGEEPEGIILTSSLLPENMAELVIEEALLRGVLTKAPKHFEIRLFCAGSASAIAVALAHPEFSQMSNVAIIALEPISALIKKEHFSEKHFQSTVIFTDEYAIMRMDPRKFMLSPHSSIVAKDDLGVIKLEPWYTLPDENQETVPAWSETLLRQGECSILRVNDQQMMIQMRSPADDEPPAVMHPWNTAKFFAGVSPELIEAVLIELSELPTHVLNHEPSKGVIQLIQKKLSRKFPELKKLLFWGVGNSSSATMFDQILQEIKLNPNSTLFIEPTYMFAPGAGATIANIVVAAKKPEYSEEVTIFSAPDSD